MTEDRLPIYFRISWSKPVTSLYDIIYTYHSHYIVWHISTNSCPLYNHRGQYWNRTNLIGFADRDLNHSDNYPYINISGSCRIRTYGTIDSPGGFQDHCIKTNSAKLPIYYIVFRTRFELVTPILKVSYSTNWVNGTSTIVFLMFNISKNYFIF